MGSTGKPRLKVPPTLAVVTLAGGAAIATAAIASCSDDAPPVDAAMIDTNDFCGVYCIPSDAGVCPTEPDGSIICADDYNGMCPPSCRPVG